MGLRVKIKSPYSGKSMEATILKTQEKNMSGVQGICVLLDQFYDYEVFARHVSDFYYRADINKWFFWGTQGDFILHETKVEVSLVQ